MVYGCLENRTGYPCYLYLWTASRSVLGQTVNYLNNKEPLKTHFSFQPYIQLERIRRTDLQWSSEYH